MDVWIHSGKGRLRWIGTLVGHLQTVKCKLHSKWEAAVELREHSAVLRDDLEAGIKLEGRLRGRECMYTHGWFTLLGSRNQHYIVKQLFSNLKKKNSEKTWNSVEILEMDSRRPSLTGFFPPILDALGSSSLLPSHHSHPGQNTAENPSLLWACSDKDNPAINIFFQESRISQLWTYSQPSGAQSLQSQIFLVLGSCHQGWGSRRISVFLEGQQLFPGLNKWLERFWGGFTVLDSAVIYSSTWSIQRNKILWAWIHASRSTEAPKTSASHSLSTVA